LFGIYIKYVNADLRDKVLPVLVKELPAQEPVVFTGETLIAPVFETINALSIEIDIIAKKLTEIKKQEALWASSQLTTTAAPTAVKLYYPIFNEMIDSNNS
jgi:hypothetical protein